MCLYVYACEQNLKRLVVLQYCGGKKQLLWLAVVCDCTWCLSSSFRCRCPHGLMTCPIQSFWTSCRSLRTWPVWTMCTPYWEQQPRSHPVPLHPLSAVWPRSWDPLHPHLHWLTSLLSRPLQQATHCSVLHYATESVQGWCFALAHSSFPPSLCWEWELPFS